MMKRNLTTLLALSSLILTTACVEDESTDLTAMEGQLTTSTAVTSSDGEAFEVELRVDAARLPAQVDLDTLVFDNGERVAIDDLLAHVTVIPADEVTPEERAWSPDGLTLDLYTVDPAIDPMDYIVQINVDLSDRLDKTQQGTHEILEGINPTEDLMYHSETIDLSEHTKRMPIVRTDVETDHNGVDEEGSWIETQVNPERQMKE